MHANDFAVQKCLFLFLSSLICFALRIDKSWMQISTKEKTKKKSEWKIKVFIFVTICFQYCHKSWIGVRNVPLRCVHPNRLWTKSAWNESKQFFFKSKYNKSDAKWMKKQKKIQPNFALNWDGSGLYWDIHYCTHTIYIRTN